MVGRFGTCSTTVNNLDHFTRDKNKNGKWSDYNGYRDPTAWISLQIPGYKNDWFGVYCPAASILWDFYDNPSMNDSLKGNNEDDSVHVTFKDMWNLLQRPNVRSLSQVYDLFLTILDESLVDEIFNLHKAPKGVAQN